MLKLTRIVIAATLFVFVQSGVLQASPFMGPIGKTIITTAVISCLNCNSPVLAENVDINCQCISPNQTEIVVSSQSIRDTKKEALFWLFAGPSMVFGAGFGTLWFCFEILEPLLEGAVNNGLKKKDKIID